MSTKDFKTIDEQLEILRSRGLIIDDENMLHERVVELSAGLLWR